MCHNYGMSVRTTIDIPDDVYDALRRRAANERRSIRSLVLEAVGAKFSGKRAPRRVEGPPIAGSGNPGPLCPDKENPYDLVFT